ncbi:MAG TPA: ubiquinol-cytochrome c reductase iron-sulfur subunit [Rhizomicrobium sp.]|nr:ubiquinol-cytochrome c reductase iron-sulfur subunit [Rhizomicrobium sp.]
MAATTSDATRRDFILVASGAMGAVAAGAVAWPLIQQMNPSAAALALATTEVDIATIQPGQQVIIKHRGQPLFVRRRTPAEIKSAQSVNVASLPDGLARNAGKDASLPASDENRVIKAEWLVVSGVCTHLGCTPAVSTAAAPEGRHGGWLCHCHGSDYDTSGRIRSGPAPENLHVPVYSFMTDTRLQVG